MLYIIMMTYVLAPSITWFLQVRSGQVVDMEWNDRNGRNGRSGK